MSGPGGDHFENQQARDNSQQHNGHNYNTNNYNYYAPYRSASTQTINEAEQHKLNVGLVKAAQTGQLVRVQRLLSKGADPDFEYTDGPEYSTPLHEAVASGSKDTVQAIIDAGADACYIPESRRSTPLLDAAERGHHEIIEVLLRCSPVSAKIICVQKDARRIDGIWKLPYGSYRGGSRSLRDLEAIELLLDATDFKNIHNIRVGNPELHSVALLSNAEWAHCIVSALIGQRKELQGSGELTARMANAAFYVRRQLEALVRDDTAAVEPARKKLTSFRGLDF